MINITYYCTHRANSLIVIISDDFFCTYVSLAAFNLQSLSNKRSHYAVSILTIVVYCQHL